jgi:hypothetical protein
MRLPLLALALCLPLRAAAEAGRTAASTLRKPLSARAMGLGGAFTAAEGGLASLGHNPAGASYIRRPEFGSLYTHGIVDDKFTFLGYAHPLSLAVLTAGLIYYDAGLIEINSSDGSRSRRSAQQDVMAMGGLSVPLSGGLSAGGQLKVMRLELAGEARAAGYAADLGALWRTPLRGLNLGASLLNAGPDVKFESEADPLPLTTRFGAAYELNLVGAGLVKDASFGFSKFLLTADAVKVRDEDADLSAGLEMGMNMVDYGYLWLRFGYLFGRDLDSLTVGLGMKEGRFTFDYALGVMKTVKNAHHISFGVKF